MSDVRVDSKDYRMPPSEGLTVAYFLTVADVVRSTSFYETVFGARITDRGVPLSGRVFIQLANAWIIVYVGGGPTDDKPNITLKAPTNPNEVSSFINLRVADIQAGGQRVHRLGLLRPIHFPPPRKVPILDY